jgi:integrase
MLHWNITMTNSIGNRRRRHHQSAKPHKDFPLTAHPSGRWCKKILGKIHFFGKIVENDAGESAQAALEKWLEQKDDLLAGREPRPLTVGETTMRDLANAFMTFKDKVIENAEIKKSTWREYYKTCERLVSLFGKRRPVVDLRPQDFQALRAAIAKKWGYARLGNEIQRVRSVFKFAFDEGLIEKPVRMGQTFKRPTLKTMRKHRAEKPPKMFEANEIHAMLDTAFGQLRAMILLGINCGFGNEDVATLRLDALDLEKGWGRHPRPKTGTERRCKLWPETIEALRDVIGARKTPTDERFSGLLFITKYGKAWSTDTYGTAVTHEMDKLLHKLKLKREGVSFYALRHTFETVAGESRDQVAVDAIMGHTDDSMAARYRERISDARLEAVTDFVHAWLFPPAKKARNWPMKPKTPQVKIAVEPDEKAASA